MVQITFDALIISKLKALGLNSENYGSALVALYALDSNDIELLDVMDDHSKSRRALILYQTLVKAGLLEENIEGDTYYQLTTLGQDLIRSIKPEDKKSKLDKIKDSVNDWIIEWLDLFPEGVKSGGKLLRSDAKSCFIKMVKFVNEHPTYTKETIFKVTSEYLSEREKEDYAYTRCAVYYIDKKGEGSDLAAGCEAYLSSDKSKYSLDAPGLSSMI